MSYVFDTLSQAWNLLREQLPPETRDGEMATRFGFLLEELHDANHRLNDAVNKDGRARKDALRLQEAIEKSKA